MTFQYSSIFNPPKLNLTTIYDEKKQLELVSLIAFFIISTNIFHTKMLIQFV